MPGDNAGMDNCADWAKQGSSRYVQLVQGSKHASLVDSLPHQGVAVALMKAAASAVTEGQVAVCVQLLHCMHLSCKKLRVALTKVVMHVVCEFHDQLC